MYKTHKIGKKRWPSGPQIFVQYNKHVWKCQHSWPSL